MGIIEDFKLGLYEEHLDEASFLYEQRARWREDPTLQMDDVLELEQRLEAHLDGLFLGAELSRKHCGVLLDIDDPTSVFTVLSLYCRQGADSLIGELVDQVVASDDSLLLLAAQEALCLDLRAEQRALALAGLLSAHQLVLALWARVIGFQRWPCGQQLSAALERAEDSQAGPVIVWALGELRYGQAEERLRGLLSESSNPRMIAAAANALAKLRGNIGACPVSVLSEHPLLCVLSEGIRQEKLAVLARGGPEAHAAIAALGLGGDPRCVPVLLDLLMDRSLAAVSAEALHLLTGAVLLETVTLESSDQLDPDLATAFLDDPNDPTDDAVAQSTVRRLSQAANQWQQWLSENPLAGNTRIRMGQPLGLSATVAALSSTGVPMKMRSWLCDELRIRTGHELSLQPELPVRSQRVLFSQLQRTAAGREGGSPWSDFKRE